MYPEGMFGLDWLRVLITPIGILGMTFFVWYLRGEGIAVARSVLLMVLIATVALAGAKLFSLWVRGWELYSPISHELRGGLRYPGALLAIVLLGPLLKRWVLPELSVPRFLDVLGITVCLCFALVRVSCFLNGCCTGIQCDGPICIPHPPGTQAWYVQLQAGHLPHPTHPSHPVLPLNLMFLLASLATGLFLIWFDKRRSFDGQLALLYLVIHDGAKGVLESLRHPYVMELQMVSLGTSAVALVALLWILRYRSRRLPAA
ncbi:MAG: prolipoprotein diacylglyceryl transferase family protein [Pseudomonadota bacterium]